MKTKLLIAFVVLITFPAMSQLIISSNTTWTTNQVLTQSVIVQQGATLTINPGVQVQVLFIDNNSDLIGDVKLEIRGSLNVAGDACNKVNFLPFVTTSNKQYWTGIEIDTLATNCSISNATVQNALIGINIENNSLNINGIEVINSKLQGINAIGTNSSISVSNSVIRGSDGEGIRISNATAFSLNNSKVRFNGTSGLSLSSVSSSTISNSVIYSNGKSGLFLLGATTDVSNSVIRKNTRMGILSSNSNLTCQYSDIDSNSVDGLFIGGNSTLNMTNSSISNNQGFGVETSEYIFNTDFGNIALTGSTPTVNLTNSNFVNNQNSTISISSTDITSMQPQNAYYIIGGGAFGGPSCGNGNGCNNAGLIPWDDICNGQGLNPNPATSWYTFVTFHIPFGMFSGFNGSIGINPTSNAWNYRPKYAISNISSPQSPFWEWSYNATNTFNPLSSYSSGCYPMNAGTFTLSDKIGFMAANGGSSLSGNSGWAKYTISEFYFTFGGYNYRSLINNTSVTDILTGNYWDTIVPTAVTNSVGAVLNLNGFVISEIVASHSNLSNSFIYSNASTFQLQQSSAPFCAGNTNYLIAPSGSYNYQWFNNGIPITNNNDSLLVSSNGIYSVLVSGSCTASSSPSTINIQSGNPITIVPSGATSFCAGNTVTLTSPSTTGNLWSNGATTQSIVVNSSGNYGLTVTNPQNCPSIAAPIQVNVIALPSSPVISSSGSTTFCENGSVFLTSNLPGNLLWSNGSTLQSISVNTSGTYNCQIISNGCASLPSNSIQVNVIPNPISTITPSGSTTFCQGNSVVLNVPLSAGNTYQWFNNGIAIPGALTNFYNATTTGNYSVFVTNNSSCSSSSSPVSVLSNPIPQAPIISANGSTSICQGNSVSLNSNIPGTLWSNGSTNQTITVSQGGVYTAQASSNGCLSANSNAINVIVNPTPSIPVITASGPTTFCSGGTVTLNSSSSSGNQWSTNSTGQSITVNTSGSYTVTTTDINGCSSTSTPVTVTVNSIPNAPTISANGPTTFCSGGNVSLISSSPNGNNWSNSVSTQSNTITTSGTYYTTVTENGCTSAQSNNITITVNTTPTQPTISANGPTTFCSGNSVVLTSSASAGNLWSNNQISQSVTITSSGTYSVQVTNNGCSNTSNPITITVNQTPAAPIINTSGPTTFCQGSNVTLTTNATLGVTWTTSNGSQFQVPTLIVQSTQSSIYATVTQNGCTSSPSLPISTTVLPIGTPTFTQIQPVCAGEPFSLPSTSNNGYTGTWSPQVNNTSTTTYTFTPSAGQCANTQSMSVTVNALPQVSLAQFNDVCDTAGLVILSGGSPNGGVYSGTSISSNTFNTSIGLGTYPVTYTFTNNNGCTNEATQDLTVILCLGSGIDDLSDKSFTVYPNPTFDVIHVKTDFLVNETLVVFDQQGRLVRRFAIDEKETILDISELAPGVYTLQIGNHLQKTRLIKK
jgi:hypothetical protein